MTELELERAKRGLGPYRHISAERQKTPRRPPQRPEGKAGHLGPLARGRLRTMIARMVRDASANNEQIREAFAAATGLRVTERTIRLHRAAMGLPPASPGSPGHRTTAERIRHST